MGNFVARKKGLGEVSRAGRPFDCMRPQESHVSVLVSTLLVTSNLISQSVASEVLLSPPVQT